MARETLSGLKKDVRIKVKGSPERSADKGTIVRPIITLDGRKVCEYRSDRNGGLYMVPVERVSVIRPKHYKSTMPVDADDD
jgi:hypothetical protein